MRMTKMLHAESDQGKYSFAIGMNFFGDMDGFTPSFSTSVPYMEFFVVVLQ